MASKCQSLDVDPAKMWPRMSGFLLSHRFKGLPTNYVLGVFPLPEPVSVSLKADIPQGITKEMEKKLKQSLGIFFHVIHRTRNN